MQRCRLGVPIDYEHEHPRYATEREHDGMLLLNSPDPTSYTVLDVPEAI